MDGRRWSSASTCGAAVKRLRRISDRYQFRSLAASQQTKTNQDGAPPEQHRAFLSGLGERRKSGRCRRAQISGRDSWRTFRWSRAGFVLATVARERSRTSANALRDRGPSAGHHQTPPRIRLLTLLVCWQFSCRVRPHTDGRGSRSARLRPRTLLRLGPIREKPKEHRWNDSDDSPVQVAQRN